MTCCALASNEHIAAFPLRQASKGTSVMTRRESLSSHLNDLEKSANVAPGAVYHPTHSPFHGPNVMAKVGSKSFKKTICAEGEHGVYTKLQKQLYPNIRF